MADGLGGELLRINDEHKKQEVTYFSTFLLVLKKANKTKIIPSPATPSSLTKKEIIAAGEMMTSDIKYNHATKRMQEQKKEKRSYNTNKINSAAPRTTANK